MHGIAFLKKMKYLKNEIWKENSVKAVILRQLQNHVHFMFVLYIYRYTVHVHVQPTESGSIGSKPSAP
jgi:hypothetical protein